VTRPATVRLVLAAALVCTPLAAGAQFLRPLGDERLDALATRYFVAERHDDPVGATQSGVHDEDDAPGAYTPDAYADRLATAKRFLAELRAIDPATMGAEASYDAQILQSHLEIAILTLGTLEPWRHQPGAYATLAATAVESLLERDFAPLATRVRSVVARERRIPAMLDAAPANLTTVDAADAELARGDVADALAYFANDVPQAATGLKDASLRAQLTSSNQEVVAALRRYLAALEDGPLAHPSGTFALGPERFAELLRLHELAPLPLASCERAAALALGATKAQFLAAAAAVDPTRPPQTLLADAAQPLSPDARVREIVSDIAALQAYVAAHRVVTLPPGDDVTVRVAPPYLRVSGAGALEEPGPLETPPAAATYDVAPQIAPRSDAAVSLAVARDVVPGTHLLAALGRRAHLSIIRRMLPSSSFAGGWARYAERTIVEDGWESAEPRIRFAHLHAELLAACRFLAALREHARGLSVDDAAAFFENEAFLDAATAHREALRAAANPLDGADELGELELLTLRDDYRRVAGTRYDAQTFHDLLLAHGAPPVAIARKILLGADDDGTLLRDAER
jgi:uncharacterized protein (DUF885 family)